MTVVRIGIRKKITDRAYAYLQPESNGFASEYVVRTDAVFPSPQLEAYALNLARAESRLYPAYVRFDLAQVKLATPGAPPAALHGQFSQIDLSKLQGQVALSEDDAPAYPPVAAVYIRQAQYGRNGRLLLSHALTVTEWNLYTRQRVIPPRFHNQSTLHQARSLFSQELVEAVQAANGSHVMPSGALERGGGESEPGLRQVTDFVFMGFQVSAVQRNRKKGSQASRRAANGAPPQPRGERQSPTEGVVYLLQAGPYFKIGKSIDLAKRLAQIKLQLPYAVEVVHVIRAARPLEVEAHWHRRFASLRRNGEWFLLTEAEVAEFKSVATM